MTIKQQGGIFGRNPTFNDVEVDGTLDANKASGVFNSLTASGPQPLTINTTQNNQIKLQVSGANTGQYLSTATYPHWFTDAAGTGDLLKINTSGNLVVNSGSGIDFSATSGTGTSELFDDYEEGTWTPTVTSTSGTITTVDDVEGFYTKIGREVTVYANAKTTNNGTGAGNLRFSGLPFTPVSTTMSATGFMGMGYNSSSGKLLRGRITGGNLRIDVANYDGTYPTANGRSNSIQVTYYV
tara:strand:+ start:184 stop:903 length:720 start_codon:yes stop_codon:yes gene_type:complete